MQDKMAFQPEAFPLEVLGSEEAETVFEDGELEDERYRGGRGGGSRQGFSARRRAPARRRRPLPRPSPPQRPGRSIRRHAAAGRPSPGQSAAG